MCHLARSSSATVRPSASAFPSASRPRRGVWLSGPALLGGLLLTLSFALPVSRAHAEPPRVLFDVLQTVGCRDVTPAEFAELNPRERLIEARFQISTFFEGGDPEELVEFLYTVDSPRKAFRVVDYEPKTTFESDYAGNLGVERKKEKALTLGLGLSGSFQHLVNADASGSAHDKTQTSVRYELVPPKELVAASGTIQRGYGVYFKLKPSDRNTLEGAKEFVVVMRVPHSWQADYLHLRCEATARRRGAMYPSQEKLFCGARNFVLALYAEGDDAARQAAEGLAQRELDLRRAAALYQREIRKRAYPSLAHKVARFLDVASPKIPENWYSEVLYGGAIAQQPAFVRHLPAEVTRVAEQYLAAKRTLHELNGTKADGPSPQLARQESDEPQPTLP